MTDIENFCYEHDIDFYDIIMTNGTLERCYNLISHHEVELKEIPIIGFGPRFRLIKRRLKMYVTAYEWSNIHAPLLVLYYKTVNRAFDCTLPSPTKYILSLLTSQELKGYVVYNNHGLTAIDILKRLFNGDVEESTDIDEILLAHYEVNKFGVVVGESENAFVIQTSNKHTPFTILPKHTVKTYRVVASTVPEIKFYKKYDYSEDLLTF